MSVAGSVGGGGRRRGTCRGGVSGAREIECGEVGVAGTDGEMGGLAHCVEFGLGDVEGKTHFSPCGEEGREGGSVGGGVWRI